MKLNCLRAVSILKKGSTAGVKDGTVLKEVDLKKRNVILSWLAMAKSLLDTVLSVAASVIASLLLKSGDVEENPGPGGS